MWDGVVRKIVVSFFFILILAGYVFIAGWVQLSVPVGSYGVLSSKTGGVDPLVLRGGSYRWAWERLFPTNAKITPFLIETMVKELSASGRLPSAEQYSAIAAVEDDFSYSIVGSLTFSLKPESLPRVVADQGVRDQAGLDAWEERTGAAAADFATRRLASYAEDSEELDRIMAAGSAPRLQDDLETAFPDLRIVSCILRVAEFPDLALYREARKLYEEYLERRRAFLSSSVRTAAGADAASRLRFEELERYGELLTKYPVLLKYLAIESSSPPRALELLKTLEE
ncbi:MAG: hypothetical protein A2Z99_11850 [Treponema sp. GWB1_62_6]|nr:MAG: hypothetical protein A2Z99_11850 [Treponema sp. GWB1_62_6]OHE69216.1 MAG: hypothetical protein A2001_13530 [Treponema sp. GWC1_61_84]OHE71084.1 MAG: hypothetical protein A2413_17150 [Treponema sp. RIFOXYC1_FULL_61_9]HCM26159.1 hypothetical protein [Treponema sp.]